MAFLSSRAPRVYLDMKGDGNVIEIRVTEWQTFADVTNMDPEIMVRGRVSYSSLINPPSIPSPTYPPVVVGIDPSGPNFTVAGKAGDPRVVGGIPEECVLTCSGCGHVDEETHVCSV